MKLLLLASVGGAIGAGLRFAVNQSLGTRSAEIGFPVHTLTVNVLGSFLMGVVFVVVAQRLGGSAEWRTFLATGILGGFTTFSAFSLEAWQLMEAGGGMGFKALAYIAASVVLSIAGLYCGMSLARAGLGA